MKRGHLGTGRLGVAVALLAGVLLAVAAPAEARSDIAAIAAANHRSEADIWRILADPTARVGRRQRIYHVDPAPAAALAADAPAAAAVPYAQTFLLHSRPGSNHVIYLDFDGHTVANTAWNDADTGPSFYAEAFTLDGDPAFSDAEKDVVQSVWQRMAEDYAIFDVDVTTQDPGQAAITRSSPADQVYGTRALITSTATIAARCACGGVAYIGVFDETDFHDEYQPAFVFARNLGGSAKSLAEAAAHEVGHNVGLVHDGTTSGAYYGGHGAWAPIMGSAYGRPISQWSRGEYASANNLEDDLAVIASHGATLVPDDHGDTAATATALPIGPTVATAGLISTDADVDVFRVRVASGPAAFSVAPAAVGPDLDVRLELRTAAGALVAADDPPSGATGPDTAFGLGASVVATLVAGGDYLVSVTGVGTGDPTTGYSGYASLGRYTLTGTVQEPVATAVAVTSSPNPSTGGQSVTFSATVSVPAPGSATGATPSGTVAFKDGTATLCAAAALTGGTTATCTAAVNGAGSHGITAVYSGDGEFRPATSPASTQTVLGAPAVAAVTSPANPSVSGQRVTYGATVARQGAGTATPTGTVTFNDGSTPLCPAVVLSAGQASCAASLPAGSHPLTVAYSGDTTFASTTSPVLTQTIAKAGTTVAVTSSSAPSVSGVPLTLRAAVATSAPGGGTPTGTVSFREGVTVLCAAAPLTAGVATCSPALAEGTHVVTAVYGGSSQHLTSTSPGLSQVVLAPGSTFVPVTPSRLLDTRSGTGGPAAPVGPGATRELVVAGGASGIPSTATAVVLNVTVTSPTATGYLTVYPTGVARPDTSSLNFVPGQTVGNLVVVGVGSGGQISMFNFSGTTQVIGDIVGYYAPTGGSTFVPVTPSRLLDTRSGTGGPAAPVGPGATRELVVAGGA
ncbi:MAG: Ig-like domain repeat protein, partial [Acidimicrobiales bacterium]